MVGDSTAARWKIYNGPLHVEFNLKIPFNVNDPGRSTSDIVIGPIPDEPLWDKDVSVADSDVGAAFMEELHTFAFPNIQKALERKRHSVGSLKKAAAKDLAAYLQASWQHEQLRRSDDPDAALAIQLGADLKWVKNSLARARNEPPPRKPTRARKKRSKLRPVK